VLYGVFFGEPPRLAWLLRSELFPNSSPRARVCRSSVGASSPSSSGSRSSIAAVEHKEMAEEEERPPHANEVEGESLCSMWL